ncbi:hypothetical protein E1B06_14725 [Brevibacillus laterosporus]|uniref:hypothetical protein n=1 Tax=Brevibacillus laterosporus TaxID=1465 RepID=UPI0024069BF5|nr:hypothetical protein [Brevibacillus laterosporus]MDF9412937.1 hypothetical protein [Brevibacillus laterosporus]
MELYLKSIFTCEDVERHEDNIASFHRVRNKCQFDHLPNRVNDLKMVLLIEVDSKEEQLVELYLEDPDGHEKPDPFMIKLKGREHAYTQCCVVAINMEVTQEGYYTFLAKQNGELLGYQNVLVRLKKEE